MKKASNNNKIKIAASAVGVAAVAGGAGYAYGAATRVSDTKPFTPVYTVTYYRLRKAKRALDVLNVRSDDENPPKFNSNGLIPDSWGDPDGNGCNARQDTLFDSLSKVKSDGTKCGIESGELFDYYTGKTVTDIQGIHIDHVVSKKNAWDSGGHQWDADTWFEYVNDERRVLIATSSEANLRKGSKDAAGWLPDNEEYWCKYVIQQIEIKSFYDLTVGRAEKDRMSEVLSDNCKAK